MALKTVLILTAGFGEGHNAASRNLAVALQARNPGARVEVHDVFNEAYGWLNLRVRDAYLAAINHTPGLWKVVFGLLDRPSLLGNGIGIFGRAARHLDALIREMEPDVIVSTYPGYGHLIDFLRRNGKTHSAKIVTLVTDSITINSAWYRPPSDLLCVPNRATADVLLKAGVARDRLRVTGFPVAPVFQQPSTRVDAAPWNVLYMVNSSHHRAPNIVRELIKVPHIALTVTAGRDAKLETQLRALSREGGVPLEVHGWVKNISELICRSHVLISKAGGATVQEALAACTPMVITQVVPGQEEGNSQLLVESGCGELAVSPKLIAQAVARLFANDGEVYRARRDACIPLSEPRSSELASACVESLVP